MVVDTRREGFRRLSLALALVAILFWLGFAVVLALSDRSFEDFRFWSLMLAFAGGSALVAWILVRLIGWVAAGFSSRSRVAEAKMTDRQLFGVLVRVLGLFFVYGVITNLDVGIAQLISPNSPHKYPPLGDFAFAAVESLYALATIRCADHIVRFAYRFSSD
jgi:hypothetical protein